MLVLIFKQHRYGVIIPTIVDRWILLFHQRTKKVIYAVGLARYDGDRGGAQEDDRTGGYKNCSDEVLNYVHSHELKTKVIFLNDASLVCC